MPSERFSRIRSLFDAAIELPTDAAEAMLARSCEGDSALLSAVHALLARDRKTTADPNAVALALRALQGREVPSMVGKRIDRYQLLSEVGAGGMGRVFKAERLDDGIRHCVALKLIRADRVQDALLRRFSEERRILACLQHSGIAHFIDAGSTDDGAPYVVMELVEGEPILAWCTERNADLMLRLSLFRQILAAVSHAHRHLVVHRDLKPGNVLVRDDGVVKLLDFGIAKLLAADRDTTQTSERVFTPAYAAPEQLRGDPVDVTCDVYALGALLYELLSGATPFDFSSISAGEIERIVLWVPPESMLTARRRKDRQWHPVRDRELGRDLENIVQRALRKEANARYASIEQFDADIARYQQGLPVLASGADFAYRAGKFVRRNRLPVVFVGLAFTAITAAWLIQIAQNRQIRHERDRAALALTILNDAFVSADPAQTSGNAVSARAILDRSTTRLLELRHTQPELFAELAEDIGQTQLAIGMVDKAVELSGAALAATGNQTISDELRSSLQLLNARALIAAGDLDAAIATLTALQPNSPSTAAAKEIVIGQWSLRHGDTAAAIVHLQHGIDHGGSTIDPALRISAQWHLAEALRRAGKSDAALQLLDTQIASLQRQYGAQHVHLLRARLFRFDLLRRSEVSAGILASGRALVDDISAIYGPQSAMTARAHSALAAALTSAQQLPAALRETEAALTAHRASFGEAHESSLRMQMNLCLLLGRTGADQARVFAEYERALSITTRGDIDAELVAFVHLEYAKYASSQNDPARALAALVPVDRPIALASMTQRNRSEFLALLRAQTRLSHCPSAECDTVRSNAEPVCVRASRLLCDIGNTSVAVPSASSPTTTATR